jgi:ribosomal protein L23
MKFTQLIGSGIMKSIDLLMALKVDNGDYAQTLSTMEYIYVDGEEKMSDQLEIEVQTNKILFKVNPNYKKYTVKEFVELLNLHKESQLLVKDGQQKERKIRGFRLLDDGILLG